MNKILSLLEVNLPPWQKFVHKASCLCNLLLLVAMIQAAYVLSSASSFEDYRAYQTQLLTWQFVFSIWIFVQCIAFQPFGSPALLLENSAWQRISIVVFWLIGLLSSLTYAVMHLLVASGAIDFIAQIRLQWLLLPAIFTFFLIPRVWDKRNAQVGGDNQ